MLPTSVTKLDGVSAIKTLKRNARNGLLEITAARKTPAERQF